MSTDASLAADSWKELVEAEEIEYSDTQLLELRENNKYEWRKYLKLLTESKQFKASWSWKGSENFSIAPFEPHHKKEVLDMILYQFSSCGNNTFHKILNTPVGALRSGCSECLDHICLTGLGYVLLDKHNHVDGVFYGWDLRDEPIWKEEANWEKYYHASCLKEDQIVNKANQQHIFANHIFEENTNSVKYGTVFFGEVLCVKPHLMHNGWFTKLSFNIAIIFGMKYEVYYDFDFQPTRHLYKKGIFDNIPIVKTALLRYDLFYFGEFEFKDGTKMSDNYPILEQQFRFNDVEHLRKNAYVGCFILRNSDEIRQFFDNDFLKCFECVHLIRTTQERILMQIKEKKKGICNYWMFVMEMYWNGLLLFLFSIQTSKKLKLYTQIVVVCLCAMCILIFS